MSNRHQRRANIAAFRRDASHGLTTYLIGVDDAAMLDREPLLRDAINYWTANMPVRKPICICCRKLFDDETIAAAFLLATSTASPHNASVSGICVECWKLPDDEIERAALRVLRTFLQNARFEGAS